MSIDPGSPIDREPLTPEERELAQRLSRLGPSAGPPSSIDARILAAAHDAVISRPRAGARKPRRWPVALGVAASLTLAVGIAWRMQPHDTVQIQSAADAEIAASSRAGQGPSAEPNTDFSAQEQKKAPAEPVAPFLAKHAAKEQPKQESAPLPAAPPIVVDEARALDVQAPAPAPPPPAPPAPAAMAAGNSAAAMGAIAASAPELERMQEAADAAASAQRAKSAAPSNPSALQRREAQSDAQSYENIEITDADDSGDEPPAYANSPEVREAWLRRVRELIAEGSAQQAHDSLHEFQRRYPDQPLPDDLQRFQQSKTDPIAP